MSYDKANAAVLYQFPLYDYGAASGARVDKVKGPKGKKGRLIDYGVMNAVENFAAATNAPTVAVGTAADADAYGEEMSVVAATTLNGAVSLRTKYDPRIPADRTSYNALLVEEDLPADTAVCLTSTEGTGAPAGQAYPFMLIAWDD